MIPNHYISKDDQARPDDQFLFFLYDNAISNGQIGINMASCSIIHPAPITLLYPILQPSSIIGSLK
jgi:hypothetical protein